MSKRFDVFAMCNALYDLQAEVKEDLLAQLELAKGGMFLLSHAEQRAIVPRIYDQIVNTEAGGSGANTAIGVVLLGGTACYTGRVGSDDHGRLFRESLTQIGVQPNLGTGEGDTGVSVILVTPDTERTLCTYLGQSQELSVADVAAEDIRDSKFLYVTGYLWDTETQKAAVLYAMEQAQSADVPIALSLSDTFCVERHREDFLHLLAEYVDVVFANETEAIAMTGAATFDEAAERLTALMRIDGKRIAAVTRDKRGSLIRENETNHEIPVYQVEAVDTTGAGDIYAAGLLYGLTQDLPLPIAGRIASYVSAQVVGKLGPRIDSIDPEAINVIRNMN